MQVNEEPLVTIVFAGLGLFCLTSEEKPRCKFGIIGCRDHQTTLDIQEVTLLSKSREPLRARLIPHQLKLQGNINVNAFHPSKDFQGVSRYATGEIATRTGTAREIRDEFDFDWVVDINSDEFHQGQISLKPDARQKLATRLTISDGLLYSARLSEAEFAIKNVAAKEPEPVRHLGRVATHIGCDIFCEANGAVTLSDDAGNHVTLPALPNLKYIISFENLCEPARDSQLLRAPVQGSDFLEFYNLVEVENGKKFDLVRAINSRGTAIPAHEVAGQNLVQDGSPYICLGGFISKVDNLGF